MVPSETVGPPVPISAEIRFGVASLVLVNGKPARTLPFAVFASRENDAPDGKPTSMAPLSASHRIAFCGIGAPRYARSTLPFVVLATKRLGVESWRANFTKPNVYRGLAKVFPF